MNLRDNERFHSNTVQWTILILLLTLPITSSSQSLIRLHKSTEYRSPPTFVGRVNPSLDVSVQSKQHLINKKVRNNKRRQRCF